MTKNIDNPPLIDPRRLETSAPPYWAILKTEEGNADELTTRNPVLEVRYANDEVVFLPDGSQRRTTARVRSSTPNGEPVTFRAERDYFGLGLYYPYAEVNGKKYFGKIVTTYGPETDTEKIPPGCGNDTNNRERGGH